MNALSPRADFSPYTVPSDAIAHATTRPVTLTLPVVTPYGYVDYRRDLDDAAATLLDAPDPMRALLDTLEVAIRAAGLLEETDTAMHVPLRAFANGLREHSQALEAAQERVDADEDGHASDAAQHGTHCHAISGCTRRRG